MRPERAREEDREKEREIERERRREREREGERVARRHHWVYIGSLRLWLVALTNRLSGGEA